MTTRRRARGVIAALIASVALAGACRDDNGSPTARQPQASSSTTRSVAADPVKGKVVVAVADLVCSDAQAEATRGSAARCRSEETAAVAKSLSPDAVLFAGDIQYDRGSKSEFATFERSGWASFKDITFPAPGNHEYATPNAAPYFDSFGARAGPRGRGYYSAEVGTWHVVSLNSNCKPAGGCTPGSPQEQWLRRDLAAAAEADRKCTVAFWHHARLSSGYHGPDESMEAIWAALADANADVVVVGHDHHYERFAPERGVRQFVAGTGGRSLYPTLGAARGSEVRNSATFGVLELRLGDGEYAWKFHGIPGTTFTDSGRDRCR